MEGRSVQSVVITIVWCYAGYGLETARVRAPLCCAANDSCNVAMAPVAGQML